MKAEINFTAKTLHIVLEGEQYILNLNQGDSTDFWDSIKTPQGVFDVNFTQESPNDKPSVTLYRVIDNEMDTDNPIQLDVETEGDPLQYFENFCKCEHCDGYLHENDFYTYDKQDKITCESCEQSAWDHPNTVVVINGDEKKTYRWCQEFGYRNAEDWEEAEIDAVPEFNYVRTDGWRGHWNPKIGEGYISIANGWTTGRWDDVSYKHGFNDFVDQIGSGELYCPFELIFAYGLTSNVFSVAGEVIIRESDFDAFSEWIAQEAGLTVEDLRDALS